MTNLYQLLDLTVNGYEESFTKRMFKEWFASKIREALESGKAPEEIDIKLNLSILKSLQAGWIIKLYDEMTSLHGENVILKDWEIAGINDGIEMVTARLPSLDPFDEVDLIVRGRIEILDYDLMAALSINKDSFVEGYTTVQGKDGDDREWEDPNDDGCAFDLFDDDE